MRQEAGCRRAAPRSALGLALDEVVNAAYLQSTLMRHTMKQPGPQGCWLWKGPRCVYQQRGRWVARARLFVILERGYLQVSPARLAYLFDAGELPARRRIKHTCHEPLCIRPDHIELAPQNKRYWSRTKPLRRQQEREAMAAAQAQQAVAGVSGETVEQIRFYAWLGEDTKEIAKQFGLKPAVVQRIVSISDAPEAEPVRPQNEIGARP